MTEVGTGLRHWSDGDLLAAICGGDRAAFSELARRHFAMVYRLAWRMCGGHADAEDLAQDAFVKLWTNPAQVRDGAAVRAWLMRVASNGAMDKLRRPRHGSIGDGPEHADERAGVERPLDRAQACRILDRKIAALPERQRLALSLVHFEELSNIEAASVMETTVEAVESLLGRARRSLRQDLSAEWRDLLAGLAD